MLEERNQTLAQLALSWVFRDEVVTSAVIGASRPEKIIENIQIVEAEPFTVSELEKIEKILS